MKLVFSYLAILLLFVGCEKKTSEDMPPNMVVAIQNRVDRGINPSIVVGIVDKRGPRYYSFGTTHLAGSEVNEHTIYEIGSISKVFTGILLAHEAETGKLNIDDLAQKYLPAAVIVPKRNGKQITLGNLSDHTSGLPRMPDNFSPKDFTNPYADYSVDQMYAFLSGYSLSRDIGSKYEYSNLAQGLLGHILALNAGLSYEELMITTIARPLGMNETKVILDEPMKKNLAIGHNQGEEVSNWDIPTLAGAGGIRSSAHDMLIFVSANIGLTPTTLRSAMDRSHVVRQVNAGQSRVGLGWHVNKGKLGDVIWHNGGTGGYRTFAGFVKETQTGVVVLTNSTEGADDIGFRLLDPGSFLKPVKRSLVPEFKRTLDSLGIDAAISYYKDAIKENDDEYDFSEGILNTLGYSYLNTNLPAALAIFKLNSEQYPNSYNVYDSYGEALMKNGDQEVAVDYYRKSLAINPANKKAIEVLNDLGVQWQPPKVNIPEETLAAYLGTYRVADGLDIKITRKGNQLYAQATGNTMAELFPKSETEFYLKVVPATITFDKKEETLTLYQSGQELKGGKVK